MKTFILLIFIFPIVSIHGQFSDTKSIVYSLREGVFDLGDFDNDGDLDVIFGCRDYNRSLVWYENTDAIGENWTPHTITENDLGNSIRNIKTVDIDNDGDLDFFASGYRTEELYLFRNNSISTEVIFNKEIIKEGINCAFLDIVNFDNDPNTFELLTGESNNFIRFSFNINQGTFTEDTLNTGNYYLPTSIFDPRPVVQIIDLDNDGDNDLLLGKTIGPFDIDFEKYFDISYGWLENTGNLDFSTYHSIESIFANESQLNCYGDCPPRIAAGNFNNDNLPDVIYYTGENFYSGLKFSSQNTDHTFADGDFISSTISYNILPFDIDEDGDLDFFSSNGWFRNDGNEVFESIEIPNTQSISKIGDVEGDGDQDLFGFQNSYTIVGGLSMMRNEGNLTFSDPSFISNNISGLSRTYPHDLDDDGDEDLMIFAFGEDKIYWAENETGDSISFPQVIIEDGDIQYVGSPVDMDNDGDADIVAHSSSYELIWFEALDATPSFSDRILIDSDFSALGSYSRSFITGDINGNGNIDILSYGDLNMQIHSNLGNGNFAAPVLVSVTDLWYPIGFADTNSDGISDIIFRKDSDKNIWVAVQDVNGNFTEVAISNLVDQNFGSILLNDLDDDGDQDIIATIKDNGCSSGCSKLVAYFQNGGSYTKEYLTDADNNFLAGVADLDGDGRKDIYSNRSWYRQLYSPNIFSTSLIHLPTHQYPFTNNILGHADLDNDNDLDLFFHRSSNGLVWIENQINNGYWISGNVFLDENQNCLNDGIDTLIDLQLIVSLELNDTIYSSSTNSEGFYNILVPDTGTYNISITTPSSYWESCINNSTIHLDTSQTTLDIPIFNSVDCPLLGMHVGGSPLRPCINGVVGLWYYNNGTTTANNVQIEVVTDDNLIIDNISPPWTSMTDSSFIFDIGDVGFNEEGSLFFYVTPDCDSVTFGDLVCVNAYITPDTICSDSLWDGSVINAVGGCEGDSVYFVLENIGTGDMITSRDYSVNIVNDDIVMLIFLDTFLLGAGETKTIALPAQGAVMQLVAEQDPNLPNGDNVSLLVTDCAALPTNEVQHLILNFPDNDGDPFTENYCRVLTGSYDPNSKEAIPLGVSDDKFIDREWEIDYTINFQNVGNDTAFTVVIVDTLTEYLDLSTLRVDGGSHPFTWQLESNRRLVFTFNNILLPDSLTNEIGSQGLVNFSIKPIPNIAFGTTIVNKAAIYFDFNEPVITDSVARTIQTPVFANSTHLELCEGDESFGFPMTSDTLVIDSVMMNDGLHLSFQHLDIINTSFTTIDTSIFLGETFLDFTINQDTTIEVTLQSVNNCDSIIVYEITAMTVSNNNITSTKNLKVFPNPTNDLFFITWKKINYPPTDIEIYDVQGLLFQKRSWNSLSNQAPNQQIKIDVNNWPPGLYTLKIKNALGSTYQKLIIFE